MSILIPPTAPHLSSGAGTIGQLVADVPRRFRLTPPQESTKKKKSAKRQAYLELILCHFKIIYYYAIRSSNKLHKRNS
jgi:hypothetical protein